MQDLLSCLESANMNDSISILAFISQIRSNFLLQHELDALSLKLYDCLKKIELLTSVEIILTYLANIETQNNIKINGYSIHIGDKWFFKLILLASLRHSKELFKKNNNITINQIYQILHGAMLTFRADKIESILIIRLIDNVVKRHKVFIDSPLAIKLLFFSQRVATSPFEGYRGYAHNISKIALLKLNLKDIKVFLDLDLLPVRGVETLALVSYFQQDKNVYGNIVTKVIQMFSNNIENREGGFLYKSILFENFSYWKEVVWPPFCAKFQTVDFEGEFFQSLVKYWIPQCISAYKLEFYSFISTEPISRCLKGHILLETRHKGLFEEYTPGMIQLISKLFEDNTMMILALKIVSCYFKRNIYPCNIELQLVNRYLYGQTGAILNNEELKCLHRFLSQIGVVGSDLYHLKVRNPYQEQQLACYKKYVVNLFTFCLKSLKTSNRDVAAQILVVFWKLRNYDSPYLLNYKLDKGGVGFYSSVFQEGFSTDILEKVLLESDGHFPELTQLGRLMTFPNKVYGDDEYLLKFIDKCTELNSIMAAESIKNVSSIIVSQNKPRENVFLLQNLFDAASKHFQHFSATLKSIFKGVLLFEAILEVSKNVHCQEACKFVGFDTYCLPVIESLLEDISDQIYENEIAKKGNVDSVEPQYTKSLCTIQKIVESLLNNMLQYIMQDHTIWHFTDKPVVMNLLVKIIETSNMRRPTTISAEALKNIAILIEEGQKDETRTDLNTIKKRNEDVSYKIWLLHDTLQKLFEAAPLQNLTIRRNPESRLVIYALCQSDKHPQRPLLTATLLHLLKILSDPKSTDSTVSSAMHCTDILISDNTLYSHTLKFVPDVMWHCVDHFKNRNWIVRNANIQLARSLIERFMGVLIGPNNRPKSAEHLLSLFPQLITAFSQTLSQEPLTDSAVIVMQIFSESQTKKQPISSDCMEIVKDVFLRLFVRIIKDNPDHYGIFAVRAFTSLCLEEHISEVIEDVITFIVKNYAYIKEKHTMRNFLHLLRVLHDKFLLYIEDVPVKPRSYFQIHANFDRFSMFLKQFDTKQFDLLSLKVLSMDEAMTTFRTSNFDCCDYAKRIWLHNYLPLILIDTEPYCLDEVLEKVLSKNILECMQVKMLSILVDRYVKNQFSDDVVNKILCVLIQRMLTIDDYHTYLIVCYFKVIFLFFNRQKTIQIGENYINQMRLCYEGLRNVRKMFVLILVLAQVINKSDSDKNFIKTTIRSCQNLNLTNFEMAETLSEMLPHLFINVYCVCDKYRLFKMAAFLIVEHGLYDFVTFLSNVTVSSSLIAMIRILDLDFLFESFGSYEIACKFVKEFYDYVVIDHGISSKNHNKTYYVEEKKIFVDRIFIDKIILKFLCDFNRKQGNLKWFRHYELLQRQSQNKR